MKTATAKAMQTHIRWMIRRDMPEVLRIESASFDFPWCEDDFIRALRNRNVIGMVAEHDEKVVGFFLYELHKTKLDILNFAVHPDYRHHGIGSQMVRKLVSKLGGARRTTLHVEVRESNLDALLFFKAMGFRAVSTFRNYYEDSGEDMVLMRYRYEAAEKVRIAE